MHQEAFKQFEKQIASGSKLMYHPAREVYDLANSKRQQEQREIYGYELAIDIPTPPEALIEDGEVKKPESKKRGRKPAAK